MTPQQLEHISHVLQSVIAGLVMLFGSACTVLWREEIVRARAANAKPTGTVFAVFAFAFFVGALLIVTL
jgi:hypothetical protein